MIKNSIIFFLAAFTTVSFAQQRPYSVKGELGDSVGPLYGANVLLLKAADSVLVKFTLSDKTGKFVIDKFSEGDYLLQISFVGMHKIIKKIKTDPANPEIDFGKIEMVSDKIMLRDVVIEAAADPIVIKKDTIEYSAAAFKTEENAPAEDLLKKLPGVEVEKDGSIKAQGKTVEKVLVNGKEFFGDDPTIATKNLPSDAIDKIQVYDEMSETAEFTGIDDGERKRTINLLLKKNKKSGYFGKVTPGIGYPDRYESRFNINRFTVNTQISALGMANNTNQSGFSYRDYIGFLGGSPGGMSGGTGAVTSQSIGLSSGSDQGKGQNKSLGGGLNFNHDFSKKTDLRTSYFFNSINSDIRRETNRINFLDGSEFTTDENSDWNRVNYNHRFNFRFKHKIDSTQDINIRGNLRYNDASAESFTSRQNFNAEGIIQSASSSETPSSGNNYNLGSNITWRKKLPKKGRSVVALIDFSKSDEDKNSNVESNNIFLINDTLALYFNDTLHQRQRQTGGNMNYRGRISYVEPLGAGMSLEANYAHFEQENRSDKDFFDVDQALQSELYNSKLSKHYVNRYRYDRGGVTFNYKKKKDISIQAGAAFQQSRLLGEATSTVPAVEKSFTNVLPSLRFIKDFSITRRLNIQYETRVNEPSADQIRPFINNNDPLNIYIGNPDLKTEYSHSLNIGMTSFSRFTLSGIFGNINATYATNKITNSVTTDSSLRQITKPINVENDMSLNGYLYISSPLKFIKSRFSLGNFGTVNRGIVFLNDNQNTFDRIIGSSDLRFMKTINDSVDISVGTKWTPSRVYYSVNTDMDRKYQSLSYYGDITISFLKHWIFNTNFEYVQYSGDGYEAVDPVSIWKASISRYLFKNKRGQIKFAVNDILDKNKGISQSSQLNYIEYEKYNTVGRYYLLTFTWSLNKMNSVDEGSGGRGMKMIR